MRNWPNWIGIRTNVIEFFVLVISSPILFIFTIFTCLYFIYVIYYIYSWSTPNAALSEQLGVFSILIGLLSILYALYSTVSTTKKLDLAQKQLSDIQTDYWNTRGIDLYKKKEYRDADLSYERAINLNPHDTKVWMNIAASLYEQSKLDEALKAINAAIEMDQSRSNSYNIKGLILRTKAINALEKHIELNTGITEVRISKYVVPFAQSFMFPETYIKLNNETSGAWDNEGEALLAQALVFLEKAIELQTIEMTHRPSELTGGWLAGVWTNIGTILYSQHKYNQAIKAYDRAIEIDPAYVAAWFNRGFALISDERPNEAIDAFNKAIQLDPKNVFSWHGKGMAFANIAKSSPKEYSNDFYGEAIHAYNKAIELDPLYHKAWFNKGWVLFNEGDYNEAIKALDKAIEIKPHDLFAWHNKCFSLYNLGKYNEVIKVSDMTIKLETQYALSWFDKYNKLNKLCKYDEAIEAYDIGFELYTKNTIYFAIKGDAICNLALWRPIGFKYALEAYDKAIMLDPFNVEAWFGKCIALNALGNSDAARKAYTRAYRSTLLTEQHRQYVEDPQKPIYWP